MVIPTAPTRMTITLRDLPYATPFRIAGHVFHSSEVVHLAVERGGLVGRGEAAGVYFNADDPPQMAAQLAAIADVVAAGLPRSRLHEVLPAGGARNALDCALWELESFERAMPVWALAGLPRPRPLLTTMTLGADAPAAMVAVACGAYAEARALKLKLTGDVDLDIDRVRAVRAARPDVWLAVDANQGFNLATLALLLPVLVDAGVRLIEQPLPRGAEADLDGLKLPIPVAADESCLDLVELETLPGRFDVVNIKLDKCGGLTEALLMARRAAQLGLQVMVGNMVGSSLAMAPAFVVGQLCDVVDLDGPLFLRDDPAPAVTYVDGHVDCPPGVWGAADAD